MPHSSRSRPSQFPPQVPDAFRLDDAIDRVRSNHRSGVRDRWAVLPSAAIPRWLRFGPSSRRRTSSSHRSPLPRSTPGPQATSNSGRVLRQATRTRRECIERTAEDDVVAEGPDPALKRGRHVRRLRRMVDYADGKVVHPRPQIAVAVDEHARTHHPRWRGPATSRARGAAAVADSVPSRAGITSVTIADGFQRCRRPIAVIDQRVERELRMHRLPRGRDL